MAGDKWGYNRKTAVYITCCLLGVVCYIPTVHVGRDRAETHTINLFYGCVGVTSSSLTTETWCVPIRRREGKIGEWALTEWGVIEAKLSCGGLHSMSGAYVKHCGVNSHRNAGKEYLLGLCAFQ